MEFTILSIWLTLVGSDTQQTNAPPRTNNALMTTHYKQFTALQLADSTNKKSDNSAVYAVSFNLLDPKYYSLLAVVINNRVAIFAVDDSGAKYLDVFVDEPNENYYTCCWAENERGEPLVLAGGQKGLIRVINLATKQVERVSAILYYDVNGIELICYHVTDIGRSR
jgi:hypothetical protein